MKRMKIPYYHVDAFADRVFTGNPAGVCPLGDWLADEILQSMAAEHNLVVTAFFSRRADNSYRLRWFTPVLEIDLCGHATLAAAFVLFTELGHAEPRIRFETRSGWLMVERRGEILELDFPSTIPAPCEAPDELLRGLGRKPLEVLKSRDFLAVFETQTEVASLKPDTALLERLDCFGVIVTARGEEVDFVSRFFAPRTGVPEDPVTGSAHCSLIPYWAERLGRSEMIARQISRRGGELRCRLAGERVGIGGRAVIYGRGQLEIPMD